MGDVPKGVRLFKAGATVLAAGVLAHWMSAGADDIAEPIDRPNAEVAPITLLEEHPECWQDGGPAAVLPGHVIWRHPDGTTVYSAKLVGPALDTLFADGNLPGVAIAFCP